MLKTFGVEDKKKRLKERVLPAEPQEYALQGKVAVGDLLASLSKQDGMKSAEHLAVSCYYQYFTLTFCTAHYALHFTPNTAAFIHHSHDWQNWEVCNESYRM